VGCPASCCGSRCGVPTALTYQNEPVGELLIGSRTGEKDFSASDRRLLAGLARQAGIAACGRVASGGRHVRSGVAALRELRGKRETGRVNMEPIRVLIADDHPFFREGLRVLLEATPDMQLVGEATDGDQAVALAQELRPDVILMDLKMPGMGGIEATRHILDQSPHSGILVVTMVEEDGSVFAAMRAGARGYLLKGADKAEMLRAIRAVACGEAIFGPGIARRLMQYFSAAPGTPAQPSRASFPELTDR